MVDRGSVVPPWEQFAASLRERISSGELAPGTRLPSVRSLSQEWDLAPGTIKKALDRLRAEGLIESRAGWGTFVTGRGE
jgi:DNA-binding GntR family transcriptional regulator